MSIKVQLGNVAAKEGYREPGSDVVVHRALDDNRVTYVTIPDSYSLAEALRCVTDPQGVWANHSDETPAWVASSSPALEMVLAEHFGCSAGVPDDVEDVYHTNQGPPGVGVLEPLEYEGDPEGGES